MERLEIVPFTEDPTPSASQQVFDQLKRMIMILDLPPGASLSEAGLMGRLEVGRTPLREALRRLSDEGFVTIYPRRGIVVRQLGLADAQYVFESRAVIEPANARSAALAIDGRRKAALEAIAETVDVAERAGDLETFMERDMNLHLTIAGIGGNPILTGFTERVLSFNAWLWFTQLKRHGMKTSDLAPHREIVAAIVAGDPETAAAAMSRHIAIARERMRLAL